MIRSKFDRFDFVKENDSIFNVFEIVICKHGNLICKNKLAFHDFLHLTGTVHLFRIPDR